MPAAQPYTYSDGAERSYVPHPLLSFLQSQSQNTLTRLYQKPSSCLSIFRLSFQDGLGYRSFSDEIRQAIGASGKADHHELTLA